ncbi:MAG: hypothetical protein AAFQ12_07255 [Pseudomonadota bacterium]
MKRTINDQDYLVKRFPSVGYAFWVLNPIIAINELMLGQRIPEETLVEESVELDAPPKEYVECPSCGHLTDLNLWSQAGAKFRNWFGLACPNCGSTLPTCQNVWSRLITLVLFPLVTVLKDRFQSRALAEQLQKLRRVETDKQLGDASFKALRLGVSFGAAMAVFLSFASLVELGKILPAIVIGLVGGSLSGLLFGGLMHVFRGKI